MADDTLQIEDFEPRHSIVITPARMVRYYEIVKLKNELYPWSSAFPHAVKYTIPLTYCLAVSDEHSSVSRMYRDLKCQHHLVQELNGQRPNIPGLAPVGFDRWMTLFVKAYPEEMYKRLQKAVPDMPISNSDKKKDFHKKYLGDCSPYMKTVGFVNASNTLSQRTQISNSLGA